MTALPKSSPLAHRQSLSAEGDLLMISEVPFVPKHILRAAPESAAKPVRAAVGLELPTDPLHAAGDGDMAILWLGPDEWMITGNGETAKLVDALAGTHHQLVDVSDYYTIIHVGGRMARPALMKITTLDVHRRACLPGRVAGSMFGHANAWLWLVAEENEEPDFRLVVRWSLADYLWCLLADAGREWGVPDEIPVSGEKLLDTSAQSF